MTPPIVEVQDKSVELVEAHGYPFILGHVGRCCSMCVSNRWLMVGSQANDVAMIVQPGMLLGLKDKGILWRGI